MVAEEGKRNWVLIVAIILVVLFVGGVIATILSTPSIEPPSSIKAELKEGGVVLSWDPPNTEVEGYRIYRGAPGGEGQLIAEVPKEVFSYKDGNVEEGKEYVYYLTSYKGGEESARSLPLSVYIEPFPPTDLKLTILEGCGQGGAVVVAFSAKNAEGCELSYDGKSWRRYRLSDSPVALPLPSQLSEKAQAYVYMKCYRMVDGKKVESDVVRAPITVDTTPPQLYGSVEVERGKAHISIDADEPLSQCVAFAGADPVGTFVGEAQIPLPGGEYLLTITCKDTCGNANYLVYPVENPLLEFEANNTTYKMLLEINGGTSLTESPHVTLHVETEGFEECRFANDVDKASDIWTEWEPAQPSWEKSWTLSGCDGKKSVYMQCRDGELTRTVKDSITCGMLNETNETLNAYAYGVVKKAVIADQDQETPLLAGGEEGVGLNAYEERYVYTGGFFVFRYGGYGGFFVWTKSTCSDERPTIVEGYALEEGITQTGEVVVLFSQDVDWVRIDDAMGNNVFEGPTQNGRVVFTPSVCSEDNRGYRWIAYRAVKEGYEEIARGTLPPIACDMTPPQVDVVCDNGTVQLLSEEPLQLAYVKVMDREYCWGTAGDVFSFHPSVKAPDVQLEIEAWDMAGNKVSVKKTCDTTGEKELRVYGVADVCEPKGEDVECKEKEVEGLSKGEQGAVVISAPEAGGGDLSGFFTGTRYKPCDPKLAGDNLKLTGTFTTQVDEGSYAVHPVTYTPCYDDGPAQPISALVLIDKKPPTIKGISCQKITTKTDTKYECDVDAEDESGIAAYYVEVCDKPLNTLSSEGNWCPGTIIDRMASTSDTFTIDMGDKEAASFYVRVYDGVGHAASAARSIYTETSLTMSLEGRVESHALDFRPHPEIPGALEAYAKLVKSKPSSDLTKNPTVALRAMYKGIERYRVSIAPEGGEPVYTSSWMAPPLPSTIDLPSASERWVITIEGENPDERVVASDVIRLDVDAPSVSLSCDYNEEGTAVICSYSAVDSGEGLTANNGISHVDFALVLRGDSPSDVEVKEQTTTTRPMGEITFFLEADDEGKTPTVYVLAEDMAGNYRIAEATLPEVFFPALHVAVEDVAFVKPASALFSDPDPSQTYIEVDVVKDTDNLMLRVEAENADECGYCIVPSSFSTGDCSPSEWHTYTDPTVFLVENDMPSSEGKYTALVVCRSASPFGKEEYVYSNTGSDSIILDTTPPTLSVVITLTSPTNASNYTPEPVSSTLAPVEETDAPQGPVYFNECPNPDVWDCGSGGYPGDGNGGGGGGSSCPYPSCPSTGWTYEPLQAVYADSSLVSYIGEATATVAKNPPYTNSDVDCSVVLNNSTDQITLDVCSASAAQPNDCCHSGTHFYTQNLHYSTELPRDVLAYYCDEMGSNALTVTLNAMLYTYNQWDTHSFELGTVDCATVGSTSDEPVMMDNQLRITATDDLSDVARVTIYRRSGKFRSPNLVIPTSSFKWIASYSHPSSLTVHNDRVVYSSDDTTADDGYILYQYKVVAYDEAGNSEEYISSWQAPYSSPFLTEP